MPANEDAEVQEALAGSNAEVVAALVENHRRFLSFLEKRVGNRALAEDILQAAFVKGLERGAALRDEESAVAWFFRVLRNALADHYRRAASPIRAAGELAEDAELAAPDAQSQAEICRCVLGLAETLKPEYAAVLKRVELEGASLQSFAQEAGITANNAAVRLFRARGALKSRVAASCGTCAQHGCLDCTCGGPRGCH